MSFLKSPLTIRQGHGCVPCRTASPCQKGGIPRFVKREIEGWNGLSQKPELVIARSPALAERRRNLIRFLVLSQPHVIIERILLNRNDS